MISKDGTISKFPGYHSSKEEEPTGQSRAYNKYGFVDHPELRSNEFASHRLPQRKSNMNGWLIEDEDEPLEHEASDKEVDSDLESTASIKPMMKKTNKANPDHTFQNGEWIIEREMMMISKDGTISKFPGYHSSKEEEPTGQSRAYNKYGFVDHPELRSNEFASHRLPQRKSNMYGWLIEDEDEPLEHEASDKEVDSDLESTASIKPMMKKTNKANPDHTFQNCPYCSK
nr:hypothetical protein [Tanacetum cinerariifolium]